MKDSTDLLFNETYLAEYFIFRIFSDENGESIGIASNSDKFYVYPPTNKDELKGLADFILNYLDDNNDPNSHTRT